MQLSTKYLGLDLRCPVVASAGPLSQTPDGVKALADTGLGAVVLYSLFEEQVTREMAREVELVEEHEESFGEALSYFPNVPMADDAGAASSYLSLLERSAKAVDVPVIGSLNGAGLGGWTRYARQLQDAGAAAIELNIYAVPGDLRLKGADVEQRHLDILAAVKQEVSVPVAVKLSPFFSSVGEFCVRLAEAGADGLVLFNRFLQPTVDVENVRVTPGVQLSTPADAKVARTWIASLAGHVDASLAATSGVDQADDVIAYLLAGADVVMTTSALIRHGVGHATALIEGVGNWLNRKGFASVDDARGLLAVPKDANPDAYARQGYVTALENVKQTYGSLA